MNRAFVRPKQGSASLGICAAALMAAAIPTMGMRSPSAFFSVSPYEILLLAAIILALLARPVNNAAARTMPRLFLTLGVVLAAWVLLCNSLVRPLESSYVWEYRASVVGALMGFAAMYLCVTRLRIRDLALFSMVIGLAIKTGQYMLSGALGSGSRYVEKFSMYEDYLISYTTHGLYAAIGFVLCLSWALRSSVAPRWKIPLWLSSGYFLWAAVVFGNRSSIIAIPLGLPLFALVPRRWRNVTKSCAAIALAASLAVVYAPRTASSAVESLPAYSAFGSFFEKQDLYHSAEARLLDWESTGIMASGSSAAFGTPWSETHARFRSLEHPHNIFLWMHICGGLPATALFLVISLLAFFAALDTASARHALEGVRDVRLVWGLLVFYSVMLGNSWVSGIPVLFGFWLGLVMGEYGGLGPDRRQLVVTVRVRSGTDGSLGSLQCVRSSL